MKIFDGGIEHRYGASATIQLYAGQSYLVEITANDDFNDGLNVLVELLDKANILTKKYCLSNDGKVSWNGKLNVVQPGEYSFTIWATDGNLTSESIILAIEAIIIPTPTPTITQTPTPTVTPTPTPWPVIVTDNLYSAEDLSGAVDYDDLKGRELCVRWRVLPQTGIRQIHIYVSKNGKAQVYLGQPEQIDDNYLIWQRGTFFNINRILRNGPEGGNNYQFFIYFIYSRFREGPYTHSGPVYFELAPPPPVGENKVIVTDNPDSWQNCASAGIIRLGEDDDFIIKWNINYSDVSYFQVYIVNPANQSLSYLGYSQSNYLVWSSQNRDISPEFKNGPQYNTHYKVRVYPVKPDHAPGHPSYYGPFETGYVRMVK